ncbi:MAG: response regulator [Cyclobacteriaceae bacterium]
MIKVFIADDHQLIVDGLMEMLATESDIDVVSTARDGNEAITKIPIVRPDVVLLDLDMPGKNGFEVLEVLRERHKEICFVVLSMHLEKALMEKAIRLGINGYLPKTVDKSELVQAIRKTHSGGKHFSADVTLGLAHDNNISSSASPFLLVDLSDREREVLKELALGHSSKVVSDNLNISHYTVETHRKNIMRKLDAHSVADLVRIAFKSGLIS